MFKSLKWIYRQVFSLIDKIINDEKLKKDTLDTFNAEKFRKTVKKQKEIRKRH